MKDSKYYKRMLSKNNKINYNNGWLNKLLLTIIVVLISLICCNLSNEVRSFYKEEILNKDINFSKLSKFYNKYMINKEEVIEVNNEVTFNNLDRKEIDGSYEILLGNMNVEALASGLIVYIGDKDNYLNTVIIQGNDGIDLWYSNIELNGYSLYDYVSKGEILGNGIDGTMLLSIYKDGEKLKYEEYFK